MASTGRFIAKFGQKTKSPVGSVRGFCVDTDENDSWTGSFGSRVLQSITGTILISNESGFEIKRFIFDDEDGTYTDPFTGEQRSYQGKLVLRVDDQSAENNNWTFLASDQAKQILYRQNALFRRFNPGGAGNPRVVEWTWHFADSNTMRAWYQDQYSEDYIEGNRLVDPDLELKFVFGKTTVGQEIEEVTIARELNSTFSDTSETKFTSSIALPNRPIGIHWDISGIDFRDQGQEAPITFMSSGDVNPGPTVGGVMSNATSYINVGPAHQPRETKTNPKESELFIHEWIFGSVNPGQSPTNYTLWRNNLIGRKVRNKDGTFKGTIQEASFETGQIAALILDFDGNGHVDALSDGLLLLREAFGLVGDALVSGAIATNANRTTGEEVIAYLNHPLIKQITNFDENYTEGNVVDAHGPLVQHRLYRIETVGGDGSRFGDVETTWRGISEDFDKHPNDSRDWIMPNRTPHNGIQVGNIFRSNGQSLPDSYQGGTVRELYDFVDALTDGLIMLRYVFGLTGEVLQDGAFSRDAPSYFDSTGTILTEKMDRLVNSRILVKPDYSIYGSGTILGPDDPLPEVQGDFTKLTIVPDDDCARRCFAVQEAVYIEQIISNSGDSYDQTPHEASSSGRTRAKATGMWYRGWSDDYTHVNRIYTPTTYPKTLIVPTSDTGEIEIDYRILSSTNGGISSSRTFYRPTLRASRAALQATEEMTINDNPGSARAVVTTKTLRRNRNLVATNSGAILLNIQDIGRGDIYQVRINEGNCRILNINELNKFNFRLNNLARGPGADFLIVPQMGGEKYRAEVNITYRSYVNPNTGLTEGDRATRTYILEGNVLSTTQVAEAYYANDLLYNVSNNSGNSYLDGNADIRPDQACRLRYYLRTGLTAQEANYYQGVYATLVNINGNNNNNVTVINKTGPLKITKRASDTYDLIFESPILFANDSTVEGFWRYDGVITIDHPKEHTGNNQDNTATYYSMFRGHILPSQHGIEITNELGETVVHSDTRPLRFISRVSGDQPFELDGDDTTHWSTITQYNRPFLNSDDVYAWVITTTGTQGQFDQGYRFDGTKQVREQIYWGAEYPSYSNIVRDRSLSTEVDSLSDRYVVVNTNISYRRVALQKTEYRQSGRIRIQYYSIEREVRKEKIQFEYNNPVTLELNDTDTTEGNYAVVNNAPESLVGATFKTNPVRFENTPSNWNETYFGDLGNYTDHAFSLIALKIGGK